MIMCIVSFFMFFFFNDTATTEIYTNLHTLSLHGALPISLAAAITSSSRIEPPGWMTQVAPASTAASRPSAKGKKASLATALPTVRSEEHTSEPQSLMRISYAVFCLKKKKQRSNNNDRSHDINISKQ